MGWARLSAKKLTARKALNYLRHRVQIPVNKLLQGFFELGMIRARLEKAGINAQTITSNDVFIFQRRVVPQPGKLLKIIVLSLIHI